MPQYTKESLRVATSQAIHRAQAQIDRIDRDVDKKLVDPLEVRTDYATLIAGKLNGLLALAILQQKDR